MRISLFILLFCWFACGWTEVGKGYAEIPGRQILASDTLLPKPSTRPSAAQLEQIRRQYGMFIHFGINTFHNEEWTDGSKPASNYNPTTIDAEQWIQTALEAGMKYVILVAKHHDGFCLWDSKYTEYDVASSGNPTNVIEAVAKACKKYDIGLGLYYSLWDRKVNADVKDRTKDRVYNTYMIKQLNELIDITEKYVPLVEFWFDGGWMKENGRWPIEGIYKTIKAREPNCQIGINWTIGLPDNPDAHPVLPQDQREGFPIRYFPSDFRLGDPYLPTDDDPKVFTHDGKNYYLPWESTICLSKRWFYHTDDHEYKTVEELIPMFKQCTKNDNILILNCPPNRDGKLREKDRQILRELRQALRLYPGRQSQWEGYDRYDFQFDGREATIVAPKQAAKGNPWIWRPAFFGAFPSVDKALLAKGFHVVYYDVTHCYGNPHAVIQGTKFYRLMCEGLGFSERVTLEGFSRGGLYALNWAIQNPEKVACIYLDAPVCDVFSWPGRKNQQLWNDLLKEWQLKDEAMDSFKGNPIDNLEPLAKAGVPIMAVCGDSDQVVPYKENMDVVRTRYLALGGPVEVILKPGVDHHPHSLENPEPVVDFILRNQSAYEPYLHYTVRGSLQNSFLKFEKERKGRVAFLGGSITEMDGWKNRIEKQLKQRFPYTEFEFVEAGIGSTGTTPGAFRIQHDVLSKGKIDLLFVEAAVNDHTNYFTPIEQVRGMEGEIRHALLSNPEMDIIMLHFIYDPFIPMVAQKQQPDVVLNHERVANHYLIPSINLVQEIGERMQDGEFTWEQFGGTHPLPFGHAYYAAAINHLFDEMWSEVTPESTVRPHAIPEMPLDTFSYYDGDFLPLENARLGKGWTLVGSWHPDDPYEKRRGFVDVPMLEAKQAGAKLTLEFEGKAIGLFCTPGPSACVLEYSVDGKPYKKLDTYTQWSANLYIPWVYMLETELPDTKHKLVLRISKEKNDASKGHELQIRNFVVN